MNAVFSYRSVIYGCAFVSGAVALVFQVVWQRYLSFLVGSEARSISLVVAVFLLGLAAGYRFWGNLTHRPVSRRGLLKTLGFIELGIAAYALVFPRLFGLVRAFAYSGPDWLAFDLLITGVLLLLPTFLMGASIPLLTAAVPESADEVNYCHSRIYGINTLGAFLGTMIAGFWMVGNLGLPMSLVVGAIAEAIVGLVLVLNKVQGDSHKAQEIPRIPNSFGSGGIYLFVFITGAVSIALEVLFVRVVGLSIGSGTYIFPIVLGVVILGLAIGSLSLRRGSVTAARVPRELIKLGIMLAALYLTIPFWPYWLSHIRISLTNIPSNHGVYLFLVTLFVAALLLPLIIPMGRLLPIGYALIDKTRDDYGRMCGRVYFTNTLGTVAGAVGLGYAMFMLLDMPHIFKLIIAVLMLLAGFLSFRSQRRGLAALCAVLAGVALLLPGWNRHLHAVGIFRLDSRSDAHFQGLFHIPDQGEQVRVISLEDDPTLTAAVYASRVKNPEISEVVDTMSIAVNAKSDGNTMGDYSNMVLSGAIPYLYAPRESRLMAAVIGLGTGMTSAALATAADVHSVVTLEISPAVIRANHLFDQYTSGLSKNPKSTVIEMDAFRYFSRSNDKFDIIVSEPSNPWVVGVDNLFTPEYYELVSRSLSHEGVLFQWIQFYEIDDEILATVIGNVIHEFEHASLFMISGDDIGILASHAPLLRPHMERRMMQAETQRALAPMAINDGAILSLLEAYQTGQMAVVALGNEGRRHSMEMPWMGYAAGRARFLRLNAHLGGPIQHAIGRHMKFTPLRSTEFGRWMSAHAEKLDQWAKPTLATHSTLFIGARLKSLAEHFLALRQPTMPQTCQRKLTAYAKLREQGYIEADLKLLNEIEQLLMDGSSGMAADLGRKTVAQLVNEFALEWQWEKALQTAKSFRQVGLIPQEDLEAMVKTLRELHDQTKDLVSRLESRS